MENSARWNENKNQELVRWHNIGFEDVIIALQDGRLLDDMEHPDIENYGHQRQLIVEIEGYASAVPYVIEEDCIFFKTLFPSCKYTKQYLDTFRHE